MKKFLSVLASCSALTAFGMSNSIAQEEAAMDPAIPAEIYACNYKAGKGPADLDAATAKWNAWADKQQLSDYSAWTLVPFYMGTEQTFDFLWLGASPNARAMGRAQDTWVTKGGEAAKAFEAMSTCAEHGNFAALQFKTAPERDEHSSFVISFSDCNIADGKDFGADIAPALSAWAKHLQGQNSTAGAWVLFPAYGGGGETYDFKYVETFGNFEEQGVDWDNYSAGGYAVASELFGGKLDCDSSRVYVGQTRRRAASDAE
jgi:hypothetical protein